jgi:uncharacterized membrane protein YkoI
MLAVIVALVTGLALGGPGVWAGAQGKETGAKAKVELPPAVAQAVKEHGPDAEIDKVTVEKEAGITLYDFEFKGDAGEMDVAEDGTVLDIATVVQMKDIPWAAAGTIRKAAEGATIKRIERSEVRAEIKEEGGKGTIVRLATPRYVYEAEMEKGNQAGEVEVTADGKLVEPVKWWNEGEKEK